jgi:signal transduction histidine kinase
MLLWLSGLILNKTTALAETYNTIGEVYLLQKKYLKAQEHLEKGLNYALEINDKKSIRFSYEKLYTCHLAQNNYKAALETKNYFLAIDEFIQSEENEKKIAELQSLYELNKKESEIMALKINQQIKDMELRDQEVFHTFLIVVLSFITVIDILVLYLYKIKQNSNKQLTITNEQINKNNEALQAANATKDKFFSIIAHDLKGPLSSLTSFSNLLINHTSSLTQEEIQMVAKDLEKSVGNLFSLLENLLEWSRSQTGIIEYTPEKINLTEIVNSTIQLLEVSAQNKNIE